MNVTQMLKALELGDPHGAEQLLPLVYKELRKLAAQKLAHERPGQTLDATALVHDAYLRLVGENPKEDPRPFKDRGHFFAAAAMAMRRILIDNARRKRTTKHGGGVQRQPLQAVPAPEPDDDLLALDQALEKLAAQDAL